jgi:hypothetical protein
VQFFDSVACCGPIGQRIQRRRVGPERVAVFGLRAEVERTGARSAALTQRPQATILPRLAEAFIPKSRGDKTAIELFVAGVQSWGNPDPTPFHLEPDGDQP